VAIKVETRDLSREVSPADTEAYMALLPQVDRRAIAEIEHAAVSRQYFRTLGQAIAGTHLYGPVAIAGIGEVNAPEIVAEYADMIGRLEGVLWVLCAGQFEGTLYLSIRTNLEQAHAGSIIRALVRGWGKAGGHGSMAGGRIPLVKSYEETMADVRERFLSLMGADNLVGEPL
jgi:nanoRNase/pAp phosphatase (c-di-AMP/oligoRNAs hydrolase)